MVTGRSIAQGIGIAVAGALGTYVFTTVLGEGGGSESVKYRNDFSRGAADIVAGIGYLGSAGAGIYHTFWSDVARRPPNPPGGRMNIGL